MPPRNSKKDENKPLWTKCEYCKYLIPHKKLESHKGCKREDGLMKYGIINNTFYTDRIYPQVPKEIEDIQSTYSERFILIPHTIATICFITMGNQVLIEFDGRSYVRNAWIINNDEHVDRIYSTSKEFQKDREGEHPMVIKPLAGTVKIAQKIVFKCDKKIQDLTEIQRLLRVKIKNTMIHQSNIVVLEFLNKEFVFTVVKITERIEGELALAMAQLDINDGSFFIVEPGTTVEIAVEKPAAQKVFEIETLEHIGGLDEIYHDIYNTIGYAFNQLDDEISTKAFRGVLLHGLSGVGKTILADALVKGYLLCRPIKIDSCKIFSKFYGESEENLRKIFDEAFQIYPMSSVIIIDEISNICPKNDSSEVVRKVSALLISLIEKVHTSVRGSKTFIIATTNNLDNVDPALRRSGRLDYEVEIPVPNTKMRKEILKKKLVNFNFSEDIIDSLAKLTHGYVGADLVKLIEKSKKIESDAIKLSVNDMLENLSSVKPSAMRELMIEKPNVKWSDVGGMQDLKLKLKQIIEWPLEHPLTFKRLGIKPPSGLLMFGAPGCSKTMIAKALANESNLNFISIKGSDLFSMWVGESEKAVRDVFIKARQLAPCIIFFDEIDAIGGARESGSSVKERVLAQILTEMDGVNTLKNVIIIAATNRPDLIDTALMRPGRLDRIVYVKLPDIETRREIFRIKLQNVPIASDVDVGTLVEKTEGYSGAEIEAICKEAALKALEDSFEVTEIEMKYFWHALEVVKPRTSPELLKIYSDYENRK